MVPCTARSSARPSIEGHAIRVSFDHVGGGLVFARGSRARPTGFTISGGDGTYHWAQTKIDGDSVVVWSDAVPQPHAVRYGWADNPVAKLYNAEGLPASPFRTDAQEPPQARENESSKLRGF